MLLEATLFLYLMQRALFKLCFLKSNSTITNLVTTCCIANGISDLQRHLLEDITNKLEQIKSTQNTGTENSLLSTAIFCAQV